MRFISILLFILITSSCTKSNSHDFQVANNKVVAHRGAWKTKNLPENSIASLKEAFRLNCTGSEFDVRMTADQVLIVNHDKEYHGLAIEESTYQELSKYKLSNGEQLPTLQDFITSVINHSTSTGLVLEIKPSPNGRNELIAQNIIKLIREMKANNIFLTSSLSVMQHY